MNLDTRIPLRDPEPPADFVKPVALIAFTIALFYTAYTILHKP